MNMGLSKFCSKQTRAVCVNQFHHLLLASKAAYDYVIHVALFATSHVSLITQVYQGMAQQFGMKWRDYSNFTLVNGSDLVQLQLSTFTNPFHIPFHCSIPYSSPLVRDAPTLFHYCEIVDLLLQATRSPRIWRWAWRTGWGFNIFVWTSIFCWFPVIPTYSHLCTVSSSVCSGYLLST